MDSASAVSVDGLVKRYGRVTALAGLTLAVRKGEIFGFLGPNGAGKTTAVKLLVGLAHATSGTGTVLGHALGDPRARAKLGYLPELFRYQDWLSAREVLELHARLSGRKNARSGIAGILRTVGLSERADDRVGAFSKGMQQRLGLGVALIGDPELVVLDEPTSALDPAGRLEVREILRTLRDRGATVFLNSHLLTEVEQVCDRIAIVNAGQVVAQGPIAEILGSEHAVRVRARANGATLESVLAPFGHIAYEPSALLVRSVAHDRIPQMVSALIAAHADVFAVEPVTATLEERFLQLTQERARD
jgi:ABC-2 type transport system ATP-binding protein